MDKYDALKLDNQLCFPLYAASREVIRRYTPFLEPLGITYTQYVTLMVLWEKGAVSVKELGAKLFLDSGTLTPVLKSLEAKGLVTRRRSAQDERVLIAELTPQGEALKDQCVDIPAKVAGCMELDPQEAAALYTILYKLLGQCPKGAK